MFKKNRCPICHKYFQPKSERNIFDCRRCFKKSYYNRKKEEEKKEKLKKPKFPTFFCPSCHKLIELDFDPILEEKKWSNFFCPFCHVLFISVWEDIVTQDSSMV